MGWKQYSTFILICLYLKSSSFAVLGTCGQIFLCVFNFNNLSCIRKELVKQICFQKNGTKRGYKKHATFSVNDPT